MTFFGIYVRQQEELWKVLFSKVPNLYNINKFSDDDKVIAGGEQIKSALLDFEIENRIAGNYASGLNFVLKKLRDWNSDLLNALKEESKLLHNTND